MRIHGWPEAAAAGPQICGGKGHRLGMLARYGFRVPRGGVIPAAWYTEQLRRSKPHLFERTASVSAADTTQPAVVEALSEIRNSIRSSLLPLPQCRALAEFLELNQLSSAHVAVRSSATVEDGAKASFAGIHQSFLNVRGLAAIERAILDCYASLWTPQALAYRRRMGFDDSDVQCAVVICEMVHAEGAEEPQCAGVAFTFDPLSGRRDLIVIDAAAGCGEAVVSGQVDPQRIVFRNTAGKLSPHSHSAGAPLLTPDRQQELARQLHRLHWAFSDGNDPQDVEWAFDGEEFWFLQARPATNVRRCLPKAVAKAPRHWSTANIKDAVPGVICTLSWSLLKEAVDNVAFAAPIATRYAMPAGAELMRRHDGRTYFELTLMQWVMYDALGITPAQVSQAMGGHQPEISVPADPWSGPQGRKRLLANLRLMKRLWNIEQEVGTTIHNRTRRLAQIPTDLSSLSKQELRELFAAIQLDTDSMDIAVGLANSASSPWEMALEAALKPVFGDKARAMLTRLLAGTGAVTSAEHGYAILRLARTAQSDPEALHWLASAAPATDWVHLSADSPFRSDLQRFLEEFGHRAVYEVDYLNPRWIEDPSYILDQVRFALANPHASAPRDTGQRVSYEAEATVRREAGWRASWILWLARKLRRAMALREAAKSALVASALPSRRIALEIGRRLAQGGYLNQATDVFHLSCADLQSWLHGHWNGPGAQALSEDRARQREAWLRLDTPPDVITEHPNGKTAAPNTNPKQNAAEAWSGIGVAPGCATGLARIIRHPNEAHSLAAGEILVAPSTDPGWTPLFLRASAIVMASGGYLSHGAIVAREYGIPAVVNLPGILSELRPGDTIVVDGDQGKVLRQSRVPELHTV
ncbi:MAG: PEP/pyruvate-binding domain-containing protein [Bryobacteraceae bacterium]